MTKRIWLFAGTFDPITKGHEALIARASRLCDWLYVAVAAEPNKKTLFSPDQRLAMVQELLPSNCEALLFNGLLKNTAEQFGVQALVRGIRNHQDYDYEENLAQLNGHLGLETIWLHSYPQEKMISSSAVKELARLGGNFQPFVSPIVEEYLAQVLDD